MDLLGGYDSDSGSESADAMENVTDQKQPPAAVKSILRNNTKHQLVPERTTTKEDASKKGKRILKLSSVLPQEILDRLQRGEGAYESDSEEDEHVVSKTTPAQRTAGLNQSKTSRSSINDSMDSDIHSLLSDLHSVIPSESKEKEVRKETMGDAFMTVSSTIIRKQKPGQVVNIHEPRTSSEQKNPSKEKKMEDLVVEDVHSDSDHDQKESNDDGITSKTVQTLFPQAEARVPIKRPLVRRPMDAAPSISSLKGIHSSIETMTLPPPQENVPAQAPMYHQTEQNEMNLDSSNQKAKRSKRDIEKALRAGNFENIDSLTTQTIDTREYDQPDEHQILATSGLAVEGSSSFRTSGLERYVPSEGMSVQGGVVGKMKGKSQIHSLVSSAASYEANQRRMAAMGMGKAKSGRADAKRKYGW
jgi:hypothetical protein